jgi:acid-activated urea channel
MLTKIDEKLKLSANLLVGFIVAVDSIIQTIIGKNGGSYGQAAAMWVFAMNYFIIAAHTHFKPNDWKVFGLYELFAATFCFVSAWKIYSTEHNLILVTLWLLWGLLWGQGFASKLLVRKLEKLTPYFLIFSGIFSTFIPGLLMMLEIIKI